MLASTRYTPVDWTSLVEKQSISITVAGKLGLFLFLLFVSVQMLELSLFGRLDTGGV